MALLQVNEIEKSFETANGKVKALEQIQLDVKKGEFITVIGPSGCGKSTLLKIVAGLDTAHQGSVLLDNRKVTGPSIKKGFIFQEPRLFPWLTVEKNIAANLPVKNKETKESIKQLIELLRLKGFENAYPKELSGGMVQRVAIARALLRNPKVLLLDEPFGANTSLLDRSLYLFWLSSFGRSVSSSGIDFPKIAFKPWGRTRKHCSPGWRICAPTPICHLKARKNKKLYMQK